MIVGYISGQKLELVAPTVVSDTINYLTTKFIFEGEAWTTLDKFVFFTKGDETYCLPLSEDRTKPEDGLNLPDGVWMVNVVGLKYDEDMHIQTQITTTACPITVSKAVAVDGPGFPDVPESAAQKIMKIIGDMESLDTTEKDNLVAAINEVLHGERDTQTDYDENDETSPAYMKNRPFYSLKTGNKTLRYAFAIAHTEYRGGYDVWNAQFTDTIFPGQTGQCTLTDYFNHITRDYNLIFGIIDIDGGMHKALYNRNKNGVITVALCDNGNLYLRYTYDSADIVYESAIIQKLDEKFIPEIDYNGLKNKPSIPTTETVTEWGFAKQEDVDAAKSKADLANTKADHALEIADGAEQDSYEAKGDAQNALDFARQAQATANGAYDVAFQAQHTAQNAESTANNAEQRSIDAIWQLANKQNTLVSGENVKTINGKSILGSGNIEVEVSGGVEDVQINGKSILKDGIANIPPATSGTRGVFYSSYPVGIQNRNTAGSTRALVLSDLDYAVKAAMGDGKGAAWTEDEQKAAQQRLGILSVEEVLF